MCFIWNFVIIKAESLFILLSLTWTNLLLFIFSKFYWKDFLNYDSQKKIHYSTFFYSNTDLISTQYLRFVV